MAIQFRRGAFADFIKSKMVAGEPAVVQSGDTSTQSGKAFYICYTPGSVDRVLTEQDKTTLDSQISDIEDDLAAAEQAIESVRQSIPAVDATLTTTGAAADAKKTGDEISDLRSDLSEISDGLTVIQNLFDKSKTIKGGYFGGTGGISENQNSYYNPEYIPVTAGIPYTFTAGLTSSPYYIAAYDSSHVFQARKNPTGTSITFYDGISFVRFSIYNQAFNENFKFIRRNFR